MVSELSEQKALSDWLRLSAAPGVGGETQRKLLKVFGLPEAVFSANSLEVSAVIGRDLAATLFQHDASSKIEADLAWAAESGNRIITLADVDYPKALLDQPDPPVLLYAKGRIELLNTPSVAVVGSRNATKQGEANAEAFAEALSSAGITIVSGLALGIDAAAHRGGLKSAASTVAVIGTGPDRIYPARNADLARRIAESGLIISEFAVGTPPLANNFPRRNRVIAGLGIGCLVVEAAQRSGSLITARLAADMGRDVFAIPGSIHSPLSRGCHSLIRQGAKLVESAQDILEELHWESTLITAKSSDSTADPAQAALLAALGHEACSVDKLVDASRLTADAVLAILMALELDGRVAQLPGGLYQQLN